MVSRPNEKKVDHVPRLFTTTRGRKHTFSTTLSHPKMSLFAALARRVATQISTSTMSSWCTADDTSALSASGLAQSASKFPSSRVPSALISGAPGFSGNHATSFDPDPRPCADSTALRRACGESIDRSSVDARILGVRALDLPGEPAHSRPFRPEFANPDSDDPKTRKPEKTKPRRFRFRSSSQSTSSVRAPVPSAVASPPATPTLRLTR